jgi:hypothetical protein
MDNIYKIKLFGKNPEAPNSEGIVSLNKENYVKKYKWYLGKDNYPFTYIDGGRIPLHRYIWFLNTGLWYNHIEEKKPNGEIYKKKLYIDHINRNKLDARDENLRISTPANNSYNKTSKSKILDPITMKPLHHIKLKKSGYQVEINKNGIKNKIDNIKSLEEAKNIYNLMAQEMFGEFAVLYD